MFGGAWGTLDTPPGNEVGGGEAVGTPTATAVTLQGWGEGSPAGRGGNTSFKESMSQMALILCQPQCLPPAKPGLPPPSGGLRPHKLTWDLYK